MAIGNKIPTPQDIKTSPTSFSQEELNELKQLRTDLIEFYKESKKLATNEDARELLTLTVDNVPSLSLEAAIKHVLLDFSSTERI